MDHVPPRCFFSDSPPTDLLTVPSCEACNGGLSRDVEYFRSRAVWHDQAAEHPDARALLAPVVRGFNKPAKKPFRTAFLGALRQVDVRTPSGLHLGRRQAMEVDLNRLNRVAEQIAKGLYYADTGEPLPSTVVCGSIAEDTLLEQTAEWRAELEDTILGPLMAEPLKDVGRKVLQYRWTFDPQRPNAAVWLLDFYEGIRFLVFMMPPDEAHDA